MRCVFIFLGNFHFNFLMNVFYKKIHGDIMKNNKKSFSEGFPKKFKTKHWCDICEDYVYGDFVKIEGPYYSLYICKKHLK